VAGAALVPAFGWSLIGRGHAAPLDGEQIAFDILLRGSPVGSHTIDFSQAGDDLQVDVAIEIDVRFAFVTLYRYRHSNREIWRDGRLVSLKTETDDDGTAHQVTAAASEAGLTIDTGKSRVLAPVDCIPTSYWHPDTVDRTELLDTQHGELINVMTKSVGEEAVRTDAGTKVGNRFVMTGDLQLDIWYSPNGELLGLAFDTSGGRIDYRRRGRGAGNPING